MLVSKDVMEITKILMHVQFRKNFHWNVKTNRASQNNTKVLEDPVIEKCFPDFLSAQRTICSCQTVRWTGGPKPKVTPVTQTDFFFIVVIFYFTKNLFWIFLCHFSHAKYEKCKNTSVRRVKRKANVSQMPLRKCKLIFIM